VQEILPTGAVVPDPGTKATHNSNRHRRVRVVLVLCGLVTVRLVCGLTVKGVFLGLAEV